MGYTLAYTGAEIDALLGKIDAIFVAEYGSTIYSEVTAAIAAGNKVIVANAGKVFVYAGPDDNSGYVFTQSGPNAAKPNATYVTLSTGNVWSTATVDLATLQQFYASFMEDTASGSIASFPDGAENVPVKELTIEIVAVQSGSGDPSPDNIRPISGYTGAEISVTGINQLREFSNNASTSAYGVVLKGVVPKLIAGVSYVLSFDISNLPSGGWYGYCGDISTSSVYTAGITTAGRYSVVFTAQGRDSESEVPLLRNGTSYPSAPTFSNVSINYPSTDTDYHAYNSTTFSTTFSKTMYGGEYTPTETENNCKQTMKDPVDLGSLSWTYNSSGSTPYFSALVSDFKYRGESAVNYLCSCYRSIPVADRYIDKTVFINTLGYIIIVDTNYTDAATFKTAVTGQTICYELATPVVTTETSHEITTLLGDNNMWANCGDISVKYRANTALYIEKKLGE